MSATDQEDFVTSNEAATMLGVALRTIQLWANSGLLECWKTSGGHRRISRDSIEKLKSIRNRQITGSTLSLPRMRILVVEDDLNMLRLYRMQLARWELAPQVEFAANGFHGLVLLGSMRPHLLITDLMMPEMNGVQMLSMLRKFPELDNTEIVVVTGLNAEAVFEQQGILDGVTILPKPVPFAELEKIALDIAKQNQCMIPANPEQSDL